MFVTNNNLDYEAEVGQNKCLKQQISFQVYLQEVNYIRAEHTTYISLKYLSRIFSRNNFLLEKLSL